MSDNRKIFFSDYQIRGILIDFIDMQESNIEDLELREGVFHEYNRGRLKGYYEILEEIDKLKGLDLNDY